LHSTYKLNSMNKNLFILKLQLTLFTTIILTSISSSAQWMRKADAFKNRSEFAGVVYNSKLYAFLGFGNSALQPETSSEVYDPVTDTWTLLASMPSDVAMTHQGVVLIDNTVWLIGGRVGQNPGPLTSDIWIYNITSDSWSRGPQLTDPATGNPIRWAAGGAVLLGRTLHIFGGFTINGCNDDQDNYHLTLDVDTWLSDNSKPAQWKNNLAPLPKKRNHFSSTVLEGKIYAIGGQFGHDCGGGLDKRFSHVYDPSTDIWTELPLLPTPRSHSEGSIFAMDGKIFLVAGQGVDNASTNRVTVFKPEGKPGEGKWKNDPSLTLPAHYEGLLSKVIGNTFIMSGGGIWWSGNPRKETYSRAITRNRVYKLGFSSGCLSLRADAGSLVKGKTLLFTIDDSKNYTTSSNAEWLTVTKNATGTAIPNAVDIEFTANTKGLAPGNYSATITATGTGGGPAYSDASYCVNLTVKGTSSQSSQTLEAETAVLNGGTITSKYPHFTGAGFVNYLNPSDDYIEWSFIRSQAGPAELVFRYANGKEPDRPLRLEVNGVGISNLSFPTTGAWTNWSTSKATVNLDAGINSVRLSAIGYSGANMDNLVVKTETNGSPNVAPSVSITTPVTNTSYYTAPATINMVAAASDEDGTISKVEFYNGTQLLHTEYNSTYSYSWRNVPAGTYSLTAKATDNKGKTTTSAVVKVIVGTSTGNIAPSVSIKTPVTNTRYTAPATVNMIATAADVDGTISRVQFYNGTKLLHTEYQGTYSYAWTNVPAGTYTITAKATDNKGLATTSSKVTISVVAPTAKKPSTNSKNSSDTPALSSLNVFPNPAGNTVFVSGKGLPQNKDFIISVVSMNGAVLKTIRANTSNKAVEVNVSSLSPGVYTIKATTGFITMNKQFVKR